MDAAPTRFLAHGVSGASDAAEATGGSEAGNGPANLSAPVIGNRNSGIYHLPHCPSYSRVGAQNRKPFETEAEAIEAGFRRAGNC